MMEVSEVWWSGQLSICSVTGSGSSGFFHEPVRFLISFLSGEAEEDAAARCQDEGEEGGYQEAGTPQTQSSVRARSGKAK